MYAARQRHHLPAPRFEITPIGQLPIAVDGMVTAPLQLVAYGRFACAGHAVDEVVLDTHVCFQLKR